MTLMLLCRACISAAVLASPLPPERPQTPGDAAQQTATAPDPSPKVIDDRTLLELIISDLKLVGEDTPAGGDENPGEAETPAAQNRVERAPAPVSDAISPVAATRAPIPPRRSEVVLALAAQSGARSRSGRGLCEDPRLEGEVIAPVSGHIAACGISAPVRVTAISGIKLSTPAQLNCQTAETFADWLTGVANPLARQDLRSGISNVWVMASYSCRTRNHRAGARLSEHSFGRAIDIGGVTLEDGRRITVLRDWNKGNVGHFLRKISQRACGPFKTVLGPEADRHHLNHFHFDVAQRRSTFCR